MFGKKCWKYLIVSRLHHSLGHHSWSVESSRRVLRRKLSSYFVTSPLFYVNAAPHLGHMYSVMMADVSQRFQKMLGTVDHVFCTGTDEHGQKIQQAATKSGEPTSTFCDSVSSKFKELFLLADIDHTVFIRTTQESHLKAVHHFWNTLESKDCLLDGNYEGWYCPSEEAFITDSQLVEQKGTGGITIKVSADSRMPVEWTTERNYIFPLSKYRDDLLHWIKTVNPVIPAKFGSILKHMVEEGLQDLSVSRASDRLSWGIPVPGDDTQTIYVWLDALIGYLTATGYPEWENKDIGKSVWPPDVQIIGKDILKFHGIYWPAFLMAAGLEPPRRILCHSHWTVDGCKMSKSLGNVIDPSYLISKSNVDAVRYFVIREGVPHSDNNYSTKKFVDIVNAELADTLGNLLNRITAKSLNPTQMYPEFHREQFDRFCLEDGQKLIDTLIKLPDAVKNHYMEFNFYHGLELIMASLRQTNSFLETHRPWELVNRKDNEDAQLLLNTVLHLAFEVVRINVILLKPIVPLLAGRALDRLRVPVDERNWKDAQLSIDLTTVTIGSYNRTTDGCAGKALGADCGIIFRKMKLSDF